MSEALQTVSSQLLHKLPDKDTLDRIRAAAETTRQQVFERQLEKVLTIIGNTMRKAAEDDEEVARMIVEGNDAKWMRRYGDAVYQYLKASGYGYTMSGDSSRFTLEVSL